MNKDLRYAVIAIGIIMLCFGLLNMGEAHKDKLNTIDNVKTFKYDGSILIVNNKIYKNVYDVEINNNSITYKTLYMDEKQNAIGTVLLICGGMITVMVSLGFWFNNDDDEFENIDYKLEKDKEDIYNLYRKINTMNKENDNYKKNTNKMETLIAQNIEKLNLKINNINSHNNNMAGWALRDNLELNTLSLKIKLMHDDIEILKKHDIQKDDDKNGEKKNT